MKMSETTSPESAPHSETGRRRTTVTTPIELTGKINRALCNLPKEKQDELKYKHLRAYQMLCIYNDGLMTPTQAGKTKLENFLIDIRTVGRDLKISFFA